MKYVIVFAVGLLLFAAGYHSGDIVQAERVMVVNHEGKTVASIGVDSAGGGFLIVYDEVGEEVFAVQHGNVRLPKNMALAREDEHNANRPFMRIESVQQNLVTDETKMADAAKLEQEADSLEAQARAKHEEVAKVEPYWDEQGKTPPSDREAYDREMDRVRREQMRLSQLALELRQESRKKRGASIRLERKATLVMQVLTGWNGQREVQVATTRDLSSILRRLGAGAFISWSGPLLEEDAEHESWQATRIERIERPAAFRDRR